MSSKQGQYTVVGHSGTMNECLVFVHVDSAISPADAERQVNDLCRTSLFMQDKLDCVVFAGHLPSLTDPAPVSLLSGGRLIKPESTSLPGVETRLISGKVKKINLAGVMDVVIHQGTEPSMTLRCEDQVRLAKTISTISGDTLILDTEPTVIRHHEGGITQINSGHGSIQIGRIFGQTISGDVVNHGPQYFGVSGNSNFSAASISGTGHPVQVNLVLPNLTGILITGCGNITYFECQQDGMDIDITGSGCVEIKGATKRLEATISGSGSINATGLIAQSSILRISGSGDIQTTTNESVRARVSGSGKIKIAGNPGQRDTNVSGSGKIKFINSL